MGTKRTFVEIVHDEGYGDQLLHHINQAMHGKDMRAVSSHDGDLLGAAKEAYSALVGSIPPTESVQGHAKARLRRALNITEKH